MTTLSWYVFQAGQAAVLLFVLALVIPFKRRCRFTVTKFLPASPEKVWEAICSIEPHPLGSQKSPALEPKLLSCSTISTGPDGSPDVVEKIYDQGDGTTDKQIAERTKILIRDEPHRYRRQILSHNDVADPIGKDAFVEDIFVEFEGGTQATRAIELDIPTLYAWWKVRQHHNTKLDGAEKFFATGSIESGTSITASATPWWRSRNLFLSVLAIGSFTLTMGWGAGLVLSLLIFLHELGHYAAMRLTGQPSVRITLIPFFGGVAVSTQPHKSHFDDAFCSLMGPGFSAFLCAALMLLYYWTGGTARTGLLVGVENGGNGVQEIVLLGSASIFAIFNLFQLLPVLPLDGGHILRSLLASLKGPRPRQITLGICLLAAALSLISGQYILALLATIGAAEALRTTTIDSTVRPMTRGETLAMTAGYFATVFIFALPLSVSAAKFGFYDITDRQEEPKTYTELQGEDAKVGSHKISPRFTASTSLLNEMPSWTFVRGSGAIASDENGNHILDVREDVRVWGAAKGDGLFGWVEMSDMGRASMLRRDRAMLRNEIRSFVRAQSANVGFRTGGRAIETANGMIDSLPFRLQTLEEHKSCIGFHGLFEDGKTYVVGGLCRPRSDTVTAEDVACLVGSISIDGSTSVTGRGQQGCGQHAVTRERNAALAR